MTTLLLFLDSIFILFYHSFMKLADKRRDKLVFKKFLIVAHLYSYYLNCSLVCKVQNFVSYSAAAIQRAC